MRDIPDTHRDLLDAEVASLSTIGDDGFPQVTMVWFLLDAGKLKLSLNTARTKTKNLRKRPECALVIVDLENPYRYLEIRARAHVDPDDELRRSPMHSGASTAAPTCGRGISRASRASSSPWRR